MRMTLDMRVCGIDDAGRGPIIGPLVIAGILIDAKELPNLKGLGVKDSKLLSSAKRLKLAVEIKELAENHHIVQLSPAEIDHVVETGKKLSRLNRLEAHAMAKVIDVLRPDIAYVDASDVLPERFRDHILEEVPFDVKVISEHKADKTYPVVSAASIIAKVERDRAIDEIKKKYGDLGSGYASDMRTIRFLEDWIRVYGSFPDFVRRSWKPAKKIEANLGSFQMRLL
jgi:ribonuclease HII